jgi:hypothetical protein
VGNTARALEQRLGELSQSPPYRNYLAVRGRLLAMMDHGEESGTDEPSAYWSEELSGFEYMFDASPLIIDKLRHHTYHLTGLKVYDYRTGKDRSREQLGERLKGLLEVGDRELLVPEAPELGGFGFEIDGALYNVDTLKYFESMLALQLGAVLPEFRSPDERKLVWEIGAGWGGLARVFKTVCPSTTYVITDLPQSMIFSGTYLTSVMPDARCRFFGDVPEDQLFDGWEELDFIFLPHTALGAMAPPRLDLTLNTVSFQEMTEAQVMAYISHAAGLECPYLYSLNRPRSVYNTQITDVNELIGRHYWPRPVSVLEESYVRSEKAKKEKTKKEKAMLKRPRDRGDYAHVIGWRKVDQ